MVEIFNTDEAYRDKEGTPPVTQCPHCGKDLKRRGLQIVQGGGVWWCPVPEPCDCPESAAEREEQRRRVEAEKKERMAQKLAEEVDRKREACNLPQRLRRAGFNEYKVTNDNKFTLSVAKKYSARFRELVSDKPPEKTGLFIYGGVGTGKTYAAACIVNNVLEQNFSVAFTSVLKLQAELRESYNGTGDSEREIMQRYGRVKLLVLDDLGKEPPTEWGLSRLFELVDRRNSVPLPVIVTSNYSPEALIKRLSVNGGDEVTARAVVDRLTQDCFAFEVNGESWRK